jgi:Pyruvate/2-oxoacid:ferredoxin oxidoreductase delta subunit
MAVRNIVKIDESKCTGCGLCATACAEGAIRIIDGKAKLVSESYCDGLGACLARCPEDAITIEQRESAEFDEEATKTHLAQTQAPKAASAAFVCPGLAAQKLRESKRDQGLDAGPVASQLSHWPVQLKLVSPTAPYFADADLLLVADCVPFAMGDFHRRFLRGHSIAVGCPKLDDAAAYVTKLAEILRLNTIRSLTVVHMEVPCCSALTRIAREAVALAGNPMGFEDVTIGLRGELKSRRTIQ